MFAQRLVRRMLLVDNQVQSELLRRLGIYAMSAVVYFVTVIVIEDSLVYRDRALSTVLIATLDKLIYWVPGLLLLGPIMMYDLLKVTNRFAGPMYSLHREMQRLVEHRSEREIRFRDHDYWNEMATTFNRLREELIELRLGAEAAGGTGQDEEVKEEAGEEEPAKEEPAEEEPIEEAKPE